MVAAADLGRRARSDDPRRRRAAHRARTPPSLEAGRRGAASHRRARAWPAPPSSAGCATATASSPPAIRRLARGRQHRRRARADGRHARRCSCDHAPASGVAAARAPAFRRAAAPHEVRDPASARAALLEWIDERATARARDSPRTSSTVCRSRLRRAPPRARDAGTTRDRRRPQVPDRPRVVAAAARARGARTGAGRAVDRRRGGDQPGRTRCCARSSRSHRVTSRRRLGRATMHAHGSCGAS